MTKIKIIIIAVLVLSYSAVYAFDETNISWYEGYQVVGYFSDGISKVKKNNKYGFINTNGEPVTEMAYDSADDFSQGLSAVSKNGKYGFIDKTGKTVIPFNYDEAVGFKNDIARVKNNGKYGLIDKTGKVVIPVSYEYLFDLSNGLVKVGNNEKFTIIDISGKEVCKLDYEESSLKFTDGLLWVAKNGKEGFINETGNVVIPIEFDAVDDFHDEVTRVSKNGKWGFIDKSGKFIIENTYDGAYSFSEGSAGVGNGGKYGFIDKTGKEIVPFVYDDVGSFSSGLAWAKKDGKYGFINNKGEEITPFVYDSVGGFSSGLAVVKSGDKQGFIDSFGNEVVPAIYEAVGGAFEGMIKVKKGANWGIINIDDVLSVKTENTQESSKTAIPTGANVMVNGKNVAFDAYNIDDNNYFKLRDLGFAVNGTNKQFEVSWDESKNSINLISNSPYSPVGGEMSVGDKEMKNASTTLAALYKDGKNIKLTAYNINDNNYFKLRDVAAVFDIGITWDEQTQTIGIDTEIGYK